MTSVLEALTQAANSRSRDADYHNKNLKRSAPGLARLPPPRKRFHAPRTCI